MKTIVGANYLKMLLESIHCCFLLQWVDAVEKLIRIMGLYDVEIMAIDTTHSG